MAATVVPAVLLLLLAGALHAQAPGTPRIPGQNPNGLRVLLWTGLKTHSPGQHDYPQFLAPSRGDLETADVVVIYKGDAGYLSDDDKALWKLSWRAAEGW